MAETLPIVNAIDNLRESNKDQRERLQKSMRAGLLNVVKSIERLGSNMGRLRPARSEIAMPQQELLSPPQEGQSNEPHFFDKLSTWFEFQTSQGARKIAELETTNRQQGKTILQLNERVVDELVPALNHLKEEITKLVRYTRLQLKQAAVSTGVQVTPRVQTLNKRLAEFDDLQMLLKQQQEQLKLSQNQYAPLHYEPIINEIKSKLEEMKNNIRISSDLEERKKLRDVYTASMRVVQSIDANEKRVADAVKENSEVIKDHGSKVVDNTNETRKNTNKRDEGNRQERKLFTNLFNNRGPLYNIFADIKEGNSRIHKWLKEKWSGEDEDGRGGLGTLATTIALLSNPLVWKAAMVGFLAYGAIKGQQNIADAMGKASDPEYDKKKSLADRAARGDQEAKRQLRIELYGTEDEEEALFRKRYGKLGVMLRDWWNEEPTPPPAPPAGGDEYEGLIEGASPVTPPEKEEGPSWWQKLLGIGDAGAADIAPSARPSSVETKKGMDGFQVMKRSADQAAKGQTIFVDNSNKVGDTNNTQITNNQNTFAPISASPTLVTPSNSDYWGRPIVAIDAP